MKNSVFLRWFLALLPIPLFFSPSMSIYHAKGYVSLSGGNQLFPFSVLYTIFLILLSPRSVFVIFHRRSFLLMLFIIYCFFSFFYKAIFGNSDGNPLLLLVSVLPLLASYIVGYNSKIHFLKPKMLDKILSNSVLVFTGFVLLHIIGSIISYGIINSFVFRGEDSIFGMFSIYQKLVYYPTIMASFFTFSLFIKSKYKIWMSIILFLGIMMVASRESMLMGILGLLSRGYYLYFYQKKKRTVYKYMTLFCILFLFVGIYFVGFVNVFKKTTFVDKIVQIQKHGNYTAGRYGEIAIAFKAFTHPYYNIFVGTGFSMTLGPLGSPHNQLFEIMLRAGVIGLLMYIFLIIDIIKKVFKNLRYYRKTIFFRELYAFAVVFIMLVFVSSNINTPVRATYIAILFGFLVGFFNKKNAISNHT